MFVRPIHRWAGAWCTLVWALAGCSGASAVPPLPASTSGASATDSGGSQVEAQTSVVWERPPDVSPGEVTTFISSPDLHGSSACSTWRQDCALGEKCAYHANDGGNAWNATHCVPLDPDPVDDGEPCTYESIATGIDDCRIGSMCWNVDPQTSIGVCRSHCLGSEGAPLCPHDETCSVNGSGFNLCLPRCDPLTQDCEPGQACVGIPEAFTCVPVAAPDGGGSFGDACEFINTCLPGLACINAFMVPDCQGSSGCCSPFCEVGTACPSPLQSCIPWFEPRAAPPGWEQVGVCGVPQ